MTTAWIGLGGNVGEPEKELVRAFIELNELPDTELRARSHLYRTKPWGSVPQADFVNAVARLETGLEAEALLDELLAIETRHGRKRRERWGPRILDLDLLLYGEKHIVAERLEVPHPRIAERAFVLVPLAELAPEVEVPGAGRVSELLARVDRGGVTPLADA
ncbi:MAG: 2-amino-4-hydroxy-6-hydroxymethyldihydropteridine diphosphokinase [Gammaproteobacteria bacterium]